MDLSTLVKVTVKDDAITENDETVTLTATTTDAQITTKNSNRNREQSQMIEDHDNQM